MRPSPPYAANAAWYMLQSKGRRWSTPVLDQRPEPRVLPMSLPGVTQVASYYGVAPGQVVASNAAQGDVVFYDWDDDGVYDHESIVVASDGTNPDGTGLGSRRRSHEQPLPRVLDPRPVQRDLGNDADRRPPHPGHNELTRATGARPYEHDRPSSSDSQGRPDRFRQEGDGGKRQATRPRRQAEA